MRRKPLGLSKQPLGRLRSLVVISDWVSFAEAEKPVNWLYKNQNIQSVETTSVIFVPVDFSRMIYSSRSYIFLYGAGIYWCSFSVGKQTSISITKQTITTDHRFLTALVIPEEKWLDNHFNTEPFVFPPPYDFMIVGDHLQEFSFNALRLEDDSSVRRAFGRGVILAQLVFPLKEPLLILQKATESYEEFDSPFAPMRVLISEFANGKIINEIILERQSKTYEETIPGIRKIKPNLLSIFPEKWSNEVYLDGLRREVGVISKDFAFIGAPMILK